MSAETLSRPSTSEAEKSLLDSRLDEAFNPDALSTDSTTAEPLDKVRDALDSTVDTSEGQDELFSLDSLDAPSASTPDTNPAPASQEYFSPLAQKLRERAQSASERIAPLSDILQNGNQIALETNEERAERGIAKLKALGSAALRKAKEIGVASIGVGVLVAERTSETVSTLATKAEHTTRSKVVELGLKASERLEARAKQKTVDAAHAEAQPYNDYLDDHTEAIKMDKKFDSQEQRSLREIRRENAQYAADRRQERREARIQRATAVPRAAVRLAGRAWRSRAGRSIRAAGRSLKEEWNK
jgi:hypothetical protein